MILSLLYIYFYSSFTRFSYRNFVTVKTYLNVIDVPQGLNLGPLLEIKQHNFPSTLSYISQHDPSYICMIIQISK